MVLLRFEKFDNVKRVCVEEQLWMEFRFYYNYVVICKNVKIEVLVLKNVNDIKYIVILL